MASSSLEGNKIISAVLVAGIVGVGSAVMSGILYSPHELAEPVYKIALPEPEAPAGGEAAGAEEQQPIGVLLASADPAAGEAVAKKCTACHSFDPGGANKVGPGLHNVVGRPVGKHEGFAYSEAMAGHGGNWDYDALNAFLLNPKGYVPGTKMSFAGLGKAKDRADLIAYLRSITDNAPPLPGS